MPGRWRCGGGRRRGRGAKREGRGPGLSFRAVDGLVVILAGAAALGDRAPDVLPDSLPARVVVKLVSNVEHATIAGVPGLGPEGSPRLGSGLGRPLILTTLEQPEAMRILAGGSPLRARLATVLLV